MNSKMIQDTNLCDNTKSYWLFQSKRKGKKENLDEKINSKGNLVIASKIKEQ